MAAQSKPLIIGAAGTVLAIDRATGKDLWSSELKGSDFVNVTFQDGELYATSKGRIYRLDPATGNILWRNDLAGLGWGIVTIAGAPHVPSAAEKLQRDREAAAASTSGAAG